MPDAGRLHGPASGFQDRPQFEAASGPEAVSVPEASVRGGQDAFGRSALGSQGPACGPDSSRPASGPAVSVPEAAFVRRRCWRPWPGRCPRSAGAAGGIPELLDPRWPVPEAFGFGGQSSVREAAPDAGGQRSLSMGQSSVPRGNFCSTGRPPFPDRPSEPAAGGLAPGPWSQPRFPPCESNPRLASGPGIRLSHEAPTVPAFLPVPAGPSGPCSRFVRPGLPLLAFLAKADRGRPPTCVGEGRSGTSRPRPARDFVAVPSRSEPAFRLRLDLGGVDHAAGGRGRLVDPVLQGGCA